MAWNTKPSRKLFKQFDPTGTEDIEEWKARFLATRDPTEYSGALELVGSWKDWLHFKRNWPHFTNNILPEWMEEMEILIRSEALRTMIGDARSNSRSATTSARWVAEGGYKPKKVGGLTKTEREREERVRAGALQEVDEDVRRVLEYLPNNGVVN